MELKFFVAKALRDIVEGVSEAQKSTVHGEIVPSWPANLQSVQAGVSDQLIGFELTVKAEENSGSEAKLTVVAALIGGGISGESTTSSSYAAKISFKVPVRFRPSAS